VNGSRGDVGDERIARRAADALADAIQEARAEYEPRSLRDREERFGKGREPVARGRDPLAPAKAIRERPGENLHHEGRGFRDAFDEPDRERARAQAHREIERQEAVDHLGRDIHEHAHEAQQPHAAWDGRGLHGPIRLAFMP
jgi:hypothetical protein